MNMKIRALHFSVTSYSPNIYHLSNDSVVVLDPAHPLDPHRQVSDLHSSLDPDLPFEWTPHEVAGEIITTHYTQLYKVVYALQLLRGKSRNDYDTINRNIIKTKIWEVIID